MRIPLPAVAILLALATTALAGCSGLRFVVDAVPPVDEFEETTVLADAGWTSDRVALVDVTGVIADAPRPGLLGPGENPVSTFVEALRRARADDDVRAVIVRINSPGGAVTATDLMYRELVRFREESGKPVVVQMGDVAASGGYYLATAADEIHAFPTTVTGSIGVIIQTVNVADGLRRIGVRTDAITSGPNKAMGSPLAPAEPGHRELLQDLVDEFYAQFRSIVEAERPGLDPSALDRVTDGRVVSGREAVEVGLVDRLGDLHDAFDAAKRLAGVERAKLIKYHRPIKHVGSAYAASPLAPASGATGSTVNINLDLGGLRTPGFYYLWDPSIDW